MGAGGEFYALNVSPKNSYIGNLAAIVAVLKGLWEAIGSQGHSLHEWIDVITGVDS